MAAAMNPPYVYAPRPNALAAGPGRRQFAVQPPALATSFGHDPSVGASLGLNHAQTPMSSLSSPFSAGQPAYVLPAAIPSTASPLALRSTPGSSGAYNPQEWTDSNVDNSPALPSSSGFASRTVEYAPRLRGPDGMGRERETRNVA
jgi:hypothetical protein